MKRDPLIFGRSSSHVGTINRRLERAAELHVLVTPSPIVSHLPEGFEVQISKVLACDHDLAIGDDGLFVLKSGILKRIAGAAGITARPDLSGRMRGPTHPHYCRYRATAAVLALDSTPRLLTGEVEIDLRERSPILAELRRSGKVSEEWILKTRARILATAETQAKSRAVCDIGIKRAFTREELANGFAVARLVWTGRTKSKSLREAFALRAAPAAAKLYGAP